MPVGALASATASSKKTKMAAAVVQLGGSVLIWHVVLRLASGFQRPVVCNMGRV
jgi:hypothetical protein